MRKIKSKRVWLHFQYASDMQKSQNYTTTRERDSIIQIFHVSEGKEDVAKIFLRYYSRWFSGIIDNLKKRKAFQSVDSRFHLQKIGQNLS
jgi:hypothetical protein